MKRCIKLLFMLLCTGIVSVSFGQNATVVFYYDDCGNRIERSLSFKKIEENGNALGDDEEKGWQSTAEDYFEGIKISLYPNPTDGKFSLAFSDKPSFILNALLFTLEGVVLEMRQLEGVTEDFDLNGRPAGVYLLRLTAGDNTQTWKIIKKK